MAEAALQFRVARQKARGPRKTDGASTSRRDGTVATAPVLAEDVQPARKPKKRSEDKVTKKSLSSARGLEQEDKALVRRLFESPMTLRETIEFLVGYRSKCRIRAPSDVGRRVVMISASIDRVNAWIMNRYGKKRKGIIRYGKKDGDHERSIKLNPRLFNVPPKVPPGSGLRNLDDVVPEGERLERRIKQRGILRLKGLSPDQLDLLERLAKAPMTTDDALDIYETQLIVKGLIARINDWAQERYSQDAIVRVSLAGKIGKIYGCWIICLNQNLFDVSYRDWDVKKHVSVLDSLTPKAKAVVDKLIGLGGWATEKELKAVGVSDNDFHRYVIRRDANTNRQAREKGFPAILHATNTKPVLYRINPECKRYCDAAIPKRRNLDSMFSPEHVELTTHLAEHGEKRLFRLAEELGLSIPEVIRRVNKLNERCGELGLSKAVEGRGPRALRIYKLTDKFAKEFDIEPEKTQSLESFFQAAEIRIINDLVKHPFSTTARISARLRHRPCTVRTHLDNIMKKCRKREELSELVKIGKGRPRFALSDEFSEQFGLEPKKVNPRVVLNGNLQQQLYDYLRRRPQATIAQAAEYLDRSYNDAFKAVKSMNKILKQAGFEPIEVGDRFSKYTDFAVLTGDFLTERSRTGQWPRVHRPDNQLKHGICMHGGKTAVMERLTEELRPAQVAEIVQADRKAIARWSLARFGRRTGSVRKACIRAVKKGVERTTVFATVKGKTDPKAVIEKLDSLAPVIDLESVRSRKAKTPHGSSAQGGSPHARAA